MRKKDEKKHYFIADLYSSVVEFYDDPDKKRKKNTLTSAKSKSKNLEAYKKKNLDKRVELSPDDLDENLKFVHDSEI